jgi:putative oxidoreductase
MNTVAANTPRAPIASSSLASPSPAALDDAGKLLLRVTIGVLVLLHGIFKLSAGVGFIGGMLAKAGLPGGLAYLVYVGEIVAPLLLIAGFWTRAAAGVIVINMIVAWASCTWPTCSRSPSRAAGRWNCRACTCSAR